MGASKDIPDTAFVVVSGIHRNDFISLFAPVFKIKDAGDKTEAHPELQKHLTGSTNHASLKMRNLSRSTKHFRILKN